MQIRLATALLFFLVILTACQPAETPHTSPAKSTEGAAPVEPAKCSDCVPVTADNFVRAESDRTFAGIKEQDGFGKFEHFREPVPIDKQVVPRSNLDTLYSVGIFDLDAGPVTITLPDAGRRFETMMVFR
jgi:hypothetical protein